MLASGCSELLRKSLQGIQRSLGTLSGAQASSACSSVFASGGGGSGGRGGGSGRGRSLRLVGSAPCLWLEVAETETIAGCLPRDLPLARCRAAVDMHLFALWRTCSRAAAVAVEGTGSADVSQYLLALLRVVHAKARATLVRGTMDMVQGKRTHL